MSLRSNGVAILAAGCVVCVGASGFAHAEDGLQAAGDKWNAWTEFGGSEGNRSEARRGEVSLWAPLAQDGRSLLFTDLRGRFFDEGENQGNFSLGYRYVGEYGWNPGFWLGLDRQHTEFGSNINQVSFGVEALSPDWDLRLNAHVPLNSSELVASATSGPAGPPTLELTGGNLLLIPGTTTVTDLRELAFWGTDAEVGFRVPLELWGMGTFPMSGVPGGEGAYSKRHSDLRVFLGGYYFDHSDFDEEIAGPRLRAEWRIENILDDWDGSRLTFDAAYQYDDVRGNQLEAGLRLRIPLGGAAATLNDALSPQEQRMTEGLRGRDVITRTRQTTTTTPGVPEQVEDVATGVDFESATIVANGADFNAAVLGAGSNALLVALGGPANFGGVTMLADQTVLGGGGSLLVRGLTTGTLATYFAPGTRPTFQAAGPPVFTTANNAHIRSLDIQTSGIGIAVGTGQRVVVEDVGITGALSRGIVTTGAGVDLSVRNSTFSGNLVGISLADQNNTLLIQDNVFRNIETSAIVIDETSAGVTSNTITAVGNRFEGVIGDYFFNFANGNTTLAAGSTGNVDATTFRNGLCIRDIGTTLTGAIDFGAGGTVSQPTCFIP